MLEPRKERKLQKLRDLHDAELGFAEILPGLTEGANDNGLRRALDRISLQSEKHVLRLIEACARLNLPPREHPNPDLRELLRQRTERVGQGGSDSPSDAARLSTAQRFLRHKIAACDSAVDSSDCLNEKKIAGMLRANLRESKEADQALTSLIPL